MKERNVYEPALTKNPTDYLVNNCQCVEDMTGVIIGQSGREIRFQKSKSYFNLIDKEYEGYHLKSKILEDGACYFDFCTKKEYYCQNINFVNNRHPDFMTSIYVKNMLKYYQSQNIKIETIRSIWTNQSDNHAVFVNEFIKNKDPISAALSTFSGKLYTSLGYGHITKQNLQMRYENQSSRFPSLVVVDFLRNN